MKLRLACLVRSVVFPVLLVIAACVRGDSSVPELSDLEQTANQADAIHSVVVLYRGEPAAEWYFEGADERRGESLGVVSFTPSTLHDTRSITKSVVSLIFGIAMSEGAIQSLDESLVSYFPDYAEEFGPDMSRVQLRHLLSMTSGIEWDERTFPYTDGRNSEIAMDAAPDRTRYILSQPVVAPPGERFNYSGGDVAMIAAIIARATRTDIERYAADKLFTPLGISDFEWVRDQAGIPIAASGLRLRPSDMAKIGQLMLQNGRWAEAQVVPTGWIARSASFNAEIQPDRQCGIQYGYYWWLGAFCDGDARVPFVFAHGNGGQRIWVVEAAESVIAITAGYYNQDDGAVDDLVLAIISRLAPEIPLP